MAKISVLIPDGENEHVLWVVRSLAVTREASVHVLSNKRRVPVSFSRHCRYDYRALADDEARIAALTDIARRKKIDVILPCSEEGVRFAIMNRLALAQLGALPPLPDLETFNIARNKWRLNQFCAQHNLPVPEALQVTCDDAFEQGLSRIPFPVLLKPAQSTDGIGISRFESADDLRSFLAGQDQDAYRDRYLVQPFVPGHDLGLSVLCRDGEILAMTQQRGIIAAAHRFGPLMAMEFIRETEITQLSHKLMNALRWSGVAHVDLRFDERDGRIRILEINARYWGSLLGSLVAGVNFADLACRAALGVAFEQPDYQLRKYAHTTTAIKEGLMWLMRRNTLHGFRFEETGLRFFCVDPLPEVVKRIQQKSGA
jgi:predicted ATP-grasp superfamily ATP-dependent carboligase